MPYDSGIGRKKQRSRDMRRRAFVASVAAAGASLAARGSLDAQSDAGTPVGTEGDDMTDTTPQTGYASVNGLDMYYEIHGSGGVPLVLLHGGLSTVEVDFGTMLPILAQTRQVIGIEQQAHGHTADIDRPLSFPQMADDTAALLSQLGIGQADVFGYSVGAAIALQLAMRYPELVRKLVLATPVINAAGQHPGLREGMEFLTAEAMAGTPFAEAYARVAPNPDDWPTLIEKIKQLSRETEDLSPADVEAIAAPALIVIGDSDIVRPEHGVEVFRLFGGGVAGDVVGLPASQLAVLPGTTHITLVHRAEWLTPMITEFLDAPMPQER
jgi:pimeloyl-ACP methyl ester carboxylesterase